MKEKSKNTDGLINIEVFIGGAPLLEMRLCEGLLEFGKSHPQWRFSMRGADFRYTEKWLKERNISGVLALINSKPVARTLNRVGIPWVHLLPKEPASHPFVTVDDHAIGRMGADFFLKKGFFKCAFCGIGSPWSTKRAQGFQQCIQEAGRRCEFIDFPFENNANWGFAIDAEKRMQNWVSGLGDGVAIMAAHDQLANRLVDVCLQEGLRIPQDIAILGVGSHDMLCELSPVPISSIDTSVPKVAISGCKMLETLIAGKKEPAPVIVTPARLTERRSTEILNYGDDLVAKTVAHIHDHACDALSVDKLLSIFPVSRRTLQRRFIKYVGHSPATEIRKTRLSNAHRMLSDTNMSLTEIAYACGYADLSHMDRSFRNILKTSPGELRKSNS